MQFVFDVEAAKLPLELKEKQPNSSTDTAVFSARRTFNVVTERREEMSKVHGFDISNLEHIPFICQELLKAQSASLVAQDDKLSASHKPLREESDWLISTAKKSASYVFRNDAAALRELERIGSTGAMPDRAGDLERVAIFCEAHPELLAADSRLPSNIVARSRELALLLTTVPDNAAAKAALARRNLAFWMLEAAVSEVRAAVRFRYPDDPDFVARACTAYEAPRRKEKAEPPASTKP